MAAVSSYILNFIAPAPQIYEPLSATGGVEKLFRLWQRGSTSRIVRGEKFSELLPVNFQQLADSRIYYAELTAVPPSLPLYI